MKKIVVIGGGSGLSTLLRGLRDYPLDITAIVAVTDDGASSGILRQDFKMLPPGDIRQCIAALSEDESVLLNLFQYRFRNGFGLKGHSFGNLLIGALKDITGSTETAIEETSKLLNIRGKVLPVTLDHVNLTAEFDNGRKITGESKITKYGYNHKIKLITLDKKSKTNPRAIDAVSQADFIFVGPGSLYTSVIPNFLQKKLVTTYKNSNALKIYICNVSTERGETEGFSVSDHIGVLGSYGVELDGVLINSKGFAPKSGDGYVDPVENELGGDGLIRFYADVLNLKKPLFHDSEKLGKISWKIINNQSKIIKNRAIQKVYDF